jgi:hypothetical protein
MLSEVGSAGARGMTRDHTQPPVGATIQKKEKKAREGSLLDNKKQTWHVIKKTPLIFLITSLYSILERGIKEKFDILCYY